ncbi:MAG: methyl-accepting chemotaxis protein, partial [Bdellovibrionota bacterium]
GLSEKIRSILVLETAKESAGRFRANLTAIVSANTGITDQQLSTVTSLKGQLEGNLKSPGLVISKNGIERINGFFSQPHWERVEEMFRIVLKRAEGGAYNIDPKEVINYTTKVINDVASLIEGEILEVNSVAIIAEAKAKKSVWTLTSVVLVFSFCLSVFLYGMASAITKPIFRVMESLRSAGHQVASAADQLQGVSQTLSGGATEAAAAVEMTVSSLDSLNGKVKNNTEFAKQASTLSQSGRNSAETGEGEIQKLISAMTDISQSSKKIEEIINVIDDIAFQTNLLALNAAVEAARAGEQGKGFAVVADAVRNLAQRSAGAAKEITGLIKDSVSQIEKGSKIADTSGAVLKNIVIGVKKVADLNNEIATSSDDQAAGIYQLGKAIALLDQSIQGNAASAEEAAASAVEMSAQSAALRNLLGDLTEVVKGAREVSADTRSNVVQHPVFGEAGFSSKAA